MECSEDIEKMVKILLWNYTNNYRISSCANNYENLFYISLKLSFKKNYTHTILLICLINFK